MASDICWINGAAVHPSLPLLITTASSGDDESGQLVMFDTVRGAILHRWSLEGGAGWIGGERRHRPRWSASGVRCAVLFRTNEIMLVEDHQIVGTIIPDESRDSPPDLCWVDERIYTPVFGGALVAFEDCVDKFMDESEFMELGERWALNGVAWSEALGAVVGWTPEGLMAIDPRAERVIYKVPFADEFNGAASPMFSPDARWFARMVLHAPPPRGHVWGATVVIHDAATGHERWRVDVPGAQRLVWGPDGWLAVVASEQPPQRGGVTHLLLLREGRVVHRLAFERAQGLRIDVAGCDQLAWSPSGAKLALLSAGELQIVTLADGRTRTIRLAPAPQAPASPEWMNVSEHVAGALWSGEDRLVIVSPHHVAFYSTDGYMIAQHVIPIGHVRA